MIKAVIFDMDGLLIDSEPYWEEVEIEVFGRLGVPMTLELKQDTVGIRTKDIVKHWFEQYPWADSSVDEVVDEIIQEMCRKVEADPRVLPGASEVIDFFEKKNMRLAIASSSPYKLIHTGTKAFGADRFEVIHSGVDEKFGKPDPATYLSTLEKLNLSAVECVVFEDSVNGFKAGLASGIRTIAVPEENNFQNASFDKAYLKLGSLKEFSEAHFQSL